MMIQSSCTCCEPKADDEPEEQEEEPKQYVNPAARAAAAHEEFPSLGDAAKQPQKSKKKGTKVALGDFLGGGPAKPTFQRRDEDILAQLPTAPRGADRPESETGPGLGGGFRDYGGFRGGPGGGGGGFGRDRDDRDGPRGRREDDFASSRADDVDDWGTTKKFEPTGGRGGYGDHGPRGGGFSDRPMGMSDSVDDWGSNKQFQPSEPRRMGGGYRDGPMGGPSKADEEEQWGRGRQFTPSEPPSARGSRGFGFGDRSAADEGDRWERRGPPPAPEPAHAAPAERPRLKLAPRTKPLDEAGASATDGAADGDQAKAKANPFGAARPREEVLKAKGVDPSLVDAPKEDLPPVNREEAPEEADMKAQVEHLRKQLEVIKASGPDPESIADEVASATEDLAAKQKELAKLSAELDTKARTAMAEAAAVAKAAEAAPPDDGTWGHKPVRGSGRDSGGGDAGKSTGGRSGRGPAMGRTSSNEHGSSAYAGAPGKDRW